jgi:hypothetical protein
LGFRVVVDRLFVEPESSFADFIKDGVLVRDEEAVGFVSVTDERGV